MVKSIPEEYRPAPNPANVEELPRYVFQELNKIANALKAQPTAFTISETSTVNVTTAVNWQRLYIGVDASWDIPGGAWDPGPAEWTCPQSGLYQVIADTRVQPFGAGNKMYYAGLALLILEPDLTLTRFETTDGGDDSVPLGVTMAFQLPISIGTRIYFEATAVHDQFSGTTAADSSAQVLRVSL